MSNNYWENSGSGSAPTGWAQNDNIPWPQWHPKAWKTNWEFNRVTTLADDEIDAHFLRNVLLPTWRYWMPRNIRNNSILQGERYMSEVFMGTPENFLDELRMRKHVYLRLVDELVNRGYLSVGPNARVSPYESFAIFIQTCAKGHHFRDSQNRFQHSNETVHRHFVKCLEALIQFAPHVIVKPDFNAIHHRIARDDRFNPYFNDCIGAIDGTHIPAHVPKSQQTAWYNRKGILTQNVLAICDFDGIFTYVYPGWEGSAHDARVMHDAESNDPNYPHPPPGKFYLVDSGYTNRDGNMAPYRNVVYHVPDWRGVQPRRPIELFNKRHSSLRNVIERSFGVLKRRFSILKGDMPSFSIERQVQLVTACCAVHNYIRRCDTPDKYDYPDPRVEEYDLELERAMTAGEEAPIETFPPMAERRDQIAWSMWENRRL